MSKGIIVFHADYFDNKNIIIQERKQKKNIF